MGPFPRIAMGEERNGDGAMGEKTDRGRSKKTSGAGAEKTRNAPRGPEAFIAEQLKAMYDEVVAQPVPDRLLDLLKRLDGDGEK
jgi:hypothetical protein